MLHYDVALGKLAILTSLSRYISWKILLYLPACPGLSWKILLYLPNLSAGLSTLSWKILMYLPASLDLSWKILLYLPAYPGLSWKILLYLPACPGLSSGRSCCNYQPVRVALLEDLPVLTSLSGISLLFNLAVFTNLSGYFS